MKILHTADTHLVEKGDHRWQALEAVLDTAGKQAVDLLAISGDFFDSDTDAENLREDLRGVFKDRSFETLIIPGNHDLKAYRSGLYFGDNTKILADPDWSKNLVQTDQALILGIPFLEISAQDFHRRLREVRRELAEDHPLIVLYHGELLDASYDPDGFGGEKGRYMPCRLSIFDDCKVNYVLGGHFHSYDIRRFGDGGYFIYPGTPTSITKRETGQRQVTLIEVGQEPKEIPLHTYHYQHIPITLNAFSEKDPVSVIQSHLEDVHPQAQLLVEVSGTIAGSEQELIGDIQDLLKDYKVEEFQPLFKDIQYLVNHPVYDLFEEHLKEHQKQEDDFSEEDAARIRELVITAMREADL